MTRPTLLLALLLAPALAVAQDAPIRWGRLTDAETALDSVAGDPDAAAVVLGDVGQADVYEVGGRWRYRLRRHLRVKVLTEAGYDEGEFLFHYRDGDRVHGVKGQTFVPEPGGGTRRVELDGRSVFEGDVADGVQGVRFTMPALAPGAVFEVSYTYETDNIVAPPAWRFQTAEPTVVSEFRFTVPPELRYVVLRQGDRIEDREPIRGVTASGPTQILRWTAGALPALRDEPYTTTVEDYTTKLALQLTAVARGDGFVDGVLDTWEEVAKTLAEHPEFGRRLGSSRLRRDVAASVGGGSDADKARALYDLVRTGYVWTGESRITAARDLNDVVETRRGSSGELGLLLLALLREADVPARPVLLSTRQNGRPVKQYPILNQFDHLLVLVEPEGGAPALLDPTDPQRPYGLLPVEALSGEAWLADARDPAWLTVRAPAGTGRTSLVQAALTPDGRLEGTVGVRLTGYEALAARQRLASDADAAAEVAGVAGRAALGDVAVDGADNVEAPLLLEATVETPAGEAVGDELYLTPFVLTHLQENPFVRPTRAFPVDFAYPFERTYVAEIALPEGWAVEGVPEPVRMTIPSRAVSYVRMVGAEGGRLTVRAVLTVSQAQVSAEEYGALRRLYDEVVAAESEAVVVTRTAPASGPPPGGAADGQ